MKTATKTTEIVVIGGGFAGLTLLKKLSNKSVNLTLVDKNNFHTFQPLLYQVATGGLSSNSVSFPYRHIFKKVRNFKFRMTEVLSINPEQKHLVTTSGLIPFDILVIATGAETNYFGNNELALNGVSLKSVNDAIFLRSNILNEFEKSYSFQDIEKKQHLLNFAIVGGGPTGVEIAGALAEFKRYILPLEYPDLETSLMQIHLYQASDRLLEVMSKKSSQKAAEYLEEMGVQVHLNTYVKEYNGTSALLSNGETLNTGTLIWTAGVKGKCLEGLHTTAIENNRYKVNEHLKVDGYQEIYAVGDVAKLTSTEFPKGHPMTAPVAIQQADLLADNILKSLENKNVLPFRYKDKGAMATIGRNKAVVDMPNFSFQGAFAWFAWMFIHLLQLIGFRNKFMVLIEWTWSYFTFDRSFQVILNPMLRRKCKICEKEIKNSSQI